MLIHILAAVNSNCFLPAGLPGTASIEAQGIERKYRKPAKADAVAG